MLKVKSLHWLLIFSLAMVFTSPATASSYKKIKAQLEKTYGVKIRFTHLKFPKYWSDTYKIRYKPVPKRDRKKALINLKKDLKKYQPHFVRHFLKTIYIFRKLSFDGAPSGGTNSYSLSSLYTSDSYLGDKDVVFHHELSSLIWVRYPSNLNKLWSKLNPIDFEYAMEGADGAEMVKNGNIDLEGSPKFWQQGFTCGYGTMDFENDFNTFFEAYMANPKKLDKLANQYSRIAKKVKLLENYFQMVKDHVEKKELETSH